MIHLTKTMMCPSAMASSPVGFAYAPATNLQLHVADRGEETDAILNSTGTVFEFLHPDSTTKLYFDVDYEAESESDCIAEKKNILNDVVSALLELFPMLTEKDLCVCSYSGQDLSVHNHNNKHGKWIVSYHIVAHGYTMDRKDNHAVATYLHNEVCEHFDTSVYSSNQMFRFGGSHKFAKRKKGCRAPKFVLYDAEKGWYELEPAHKVSKDERMEVKYKNLITYTSSEMPVLEVPECVSAHAPAPKPKSATPDSAPPQAPPPPTNNQAEPDAEMLALLNRLPSTDRDEYKSWYYISTLCKALDIQSTWDAWSKQSSRYNANQNLTHWSTIKDYAKFASNAERILTKRANKHETDPRIWKLHEAYETNTDLSHAKFFVKQYGDFFRVVDDKLMYFYDKHTQLWILSTPSCIHTFMMDGEYKMLCDDYVAEFYANPEKYFGKVPSDCKEPDKYYPQLQNARKLAVSASQMNKTLNAWSKMILADSALRDSKFPYKLNSKRDYLPVLNGMVNLRDGTIRPRKFDDYCSQCLDIEYDTTVKPEQNPAFMSFVRSIFDAKELDTDEVLDWFHHWMGYCITGYSNMEACCIYFGGGANGKSLLQEVLVNTLKCTTGSMVDTWNYKIIDESSNVGNANSATPELAKMEGVRVGVINELADGMVLSEAFKRMIDCTEALSVRQLHQKSKIIAHTTVFNLLTNSFPHFKANYCYMRRIKVLPMLMKYCPKPDESTNPNARLVDTSLKQRMFETAIGRRAILAWFVQGAMRFLANPKVIETQPACCEKYKEEYVRMNDYMRLFVKSDDKKDRITIVDAIEYIRTQFEKVPSQAELTEKLKELTGCDKVCKVEGINGKRNNGFWYVKMLNNEPDEEEADGYAFK